MAFRVEISPEALGNLDEIAATSSSTEVSKALSVGSMGSSSQFDLLAKCRAARLLLHGKRNHRYKVYFAIQQESETVRVFHIRHWARKPAEKSELEELEKRKPGR